MFAATKHLFAIPSGSGGYYPITPSTISVAGDLRAVALSPDESEVWVATNAGTVEVVSTATETVTETITLAGNCRGIAFTGDGSAAWVACGQEGIKQIDVATKAVSLSIPVAGGYIWSLTVDGGNVYAVDYFQADLLVLDAATGSISDTIDLGTGNPRLISVSPDGSKALVSHIFGGVVDLVTGTAQNYPSGLLPWNALHAGAKAYLGYSSSPEFGFKVLDTATNTVTDTVDMAALTGYNSASPLGLVGKYLYLSASNVISVVNVDTLEVLTTITGITGAFLLSWAAFTADGLTAYIAGGNNPLLKLT